MPVEIASGSTSEELYGTSLLGLETCSCPARAECGLEK